jgi:trigger factor
VKVTSERTEDCQALLNIEVEPDLVEKYMERAYRRLVNRINIPGFRKGKAPRFMVERLVGREGLFQEGVEIMFPDVFKSAVEEAQIRPFDTPQYEIVQEEPLTLKVTVPLEPQVVLGNYKDIRLDREEVDVSDEEVQSVLDHLRDQQSTWSPVDRPAAMGDRVTIDIDGAVKEEPLIESAGGESLIGGKGEQILKTEGTDYPVKEQPDSFLPGFAEQLVGLKAGDEKEFVITLPPNYPEEHLAGKEAVFSVRCQAVREVNKPEFDDEFAKTVGDFETFEAMREAVRENIVKQKTDEADKRFNDALIGMVVDRSTVEMPPSLVEHEIDHAIERLSGRLQESGMNLDRFLAATSKSKEQLREEFRVSSRQRLANALALAEVAKAEGIAVSTDDIEQEIQNATEGLADAEAAKVRTAFGDQDMRERLGHSIWERKVVERLATIASGDAETQATEPNTSVDKGVGEVKEEEKAGD